MPRSPIRWLGVLCVTALISVGAVSAQEPTTLTLNIPPYLENAINDELLSQFESQYPGTDVQLKTTQMGINGNPIYDVEEYLQNSLEYASEADVVYADSALRPEATRAGHYLDLRPLTDTDAAFNAADFYLGALDAFRWDNGLWALPASTDLYTLTYDPAAFDAAGLPYPNAGWTLDDLANAARALAVRGSDGQITTPGLGMLGPDAFQLLAYAFSGAEFFDPTTLPELPRLSGNAALETFLTRWAELETEGVVTRSIGEDYDAFPMRVEPTFGLNAMPGAATTRAAAPFPGGVTSMTAQGFAVSGGTQHPELAYALANWLTTRSEVATGLFGYAPARQSVSTMQPGGDQPVMFRNFAPETAAFLDSSLGTARSFGALRYSSYVWRALELMTQQGSNAASALQQAELEAISNLETAAQMRQSTPVVVATPVPAPVLADGEVALNFGLVSMMSPMPNQDRWEQVLSDFAAADPQVGAVNLDTAMGSSISEMAQQYDCFALPYNAVPSITPDQVLNLDPYLDADPTFDPADLIGGLLAQIQRDNRTWALPLAVHPEVLRYQPDIFAQAGIPTPQNGWTVDQFVDALNALKSQTGDEPAFETRTPGSSYLSMLIAAFGGLPLDFRTTPATINFTDANTVQAIQQVLDLAKAGLIDYQEQAGGGMIVISVGSSEAPVPLYSQTLNGMDFMGPGLESEQQPVLYGMASYPSGTQFTPAIYDVTTSFISATSQNPDACYRLLSALARTPDLFNAMPTRRSLINDPAVAAAQGQEAVNFYNQYDALLQSPTTITLPSASAGASQMSYLLQYWLGRAFDEYVLRDGDLITELTEAQTYATAYQQCAANLPPFNPAAPDVTQQLQGIRDCAVAADPSIISLFPPM